MRLTDATYLRNVGNQVKTVPMMFMG